MTRLFSDERADNNGLTKAGGAPHMLAITPMGGWLSNVFLSSGGFQGLGLGPGA